MQKLLTIVVPVYKVEPYINKCLDSCILADEKLMSQLEVIIVNDGTPDNSAEMSREYVKRYPQIFRQIDKENGGHGSAWNVGIKEATGKYLRFLDSDDWLSNLAEFMQKLTTTNADIVQTNYQRYYVQRDEYVVYRSIISPDKEQPLTRELLHTLSHGYIDINFWSSTYKTSILQPLYPLMAERVMYDDSILSFAPLIYGRTIVSFDLVLYNYLIGREGQSMDTKVQQRNARSYVACLKREEDLINSTRSIDIPADLKQCINEVVTQYAHFVFSYFVYLPYKESKAQMAYIVTTYPWENEVKPHIYKRYARFPFWLFYCIEKCRSIYLQMHK
jgi:glycosyltransferase involved in cell wall biosynthesis